MVRPSTIVSSCSSGLIAICLLLPNQSAAFGGEPPAFNPFAPVQTEREDAVAGYLEMSDGHVHVGDIYLTRDKRLKVFDAEMQRQREIPLRAVKQIECRVLKEWMEKEWRFRELASNEKYYTGREYPARQYEYTIILQDGRAITGALAEIVYVRPYAYSPGEPRAYRPEAKPERFLLHKRDKGDIGTDLKTLVYVQTIKLGNEALEEGKKRARTPRPASR